MRNFNLSSHLAAECRSSSISVDNALLLDIGNLQSRDTSDNDAKASRLEQQAVCVDGACVVLLAIQRASGQITQGPEQGMAVSEEVSVQSELLVSNLFVLLECVALPMHSRQAVFIERSPRCCRCHITWRYLPPNVTASVMTMFGQHAGRHMLGADVC